MNNNIVLTLDAGGTNLVFSAVKDYKEIVEPVRLISHSDNLDLMLNTIIKGFKEVAAKLQEKPVAISFAFPGPADYKRGIIGDLGNLPCFRGGVALGPMLKKYFNLPVFINNDGDLYAFGESIDGFLPEVNNELKKNDSPKIFKNIVGITLGTGFGAGIVSNGQILLGDNIVAGEVWLMSNRYYTGINAEECVSIRAVRRKYAEMAGMPLNATPEPKDIYLIGMGEKEGNTQAALKAFEELGTVLGDVLANLVTLTDGLIVIGGGIAGAKDLILPALMKEMNGHFTNHDKKQYPRLVQKVYNWHDPNEKARFIKGETKKIMIPGTSSEISYDPLARICIAFSKMDTSKAISIGAYAFALKSLNKL